MRSSRESLVLYQTYRSRKINEANLYYNLEWLLCCINVEGCNSSYTYSSGACIKSLDQCHKSRQCTRTCSPIRYSEPQLPPSKTTYNQIKMATPPRSSVGERQERPISTGRSTIPPDCLSYLSIPPSNLNQHHVTCQRLLSLHKLMIEAAQMPRRSTRGPVDLSQ